VKFCKLPWAIFVVAVVYRQLYGWANVFFLSNLLMEERERERERDSNKCNASQFDGQHILTTSTFF
jgi:hypothetical protein